MMIDDMAQTNYRYKTGDTCPISGVYEFDGYLDGTRTPAPTREEQQIPLDRG